MSWRKNKFSYFMWFLYTLFTVAVLMLATEAQAEKMFGKIPFGGLIPGFVIAVLTGLAVYLRQQFLERKRNKAKVDTSLSGKTAQSSAKSRVVWEIVAVAALLVVGLIFRLDRMLDGHGDLSAYYETAMVMEGQVIPPVVHGADYLYLQVLHLLFLFVGNKFVAAVWLQIILQLLAALLLFAGVRRLAGPAASLVMFGFFMFAGTMIDGAVILSPQMLYLLLLAIGIDFLAACQKNRLNYLAFLVAGIWIGVMGYLDIGGFLLLILLASCAAGDRKAMTDRKSKLGAFCFGFIGTLAGFLGTIGADAFISGKTYGSVLNAWMGLYSPGDFQASVPFHDVGSGWWTVVLTVFMIAGVFGFWYDKESDRMSMWVLGGWVSVVAGCFGMFTEELPMYLYLFLFLVVLAGLGVGEIYNEPIENGSEDMETEETEVTEVAEVTEESQMAKKEKKVKRGKNDKKEMEASVAQGQETQAPLGIGPIPVKLPKYLREAGSGKIKIPAYMLPEEPPKVSKPVETMPEEEPAEAPAAEWVPEESAEMPAAEWVPEEEPADTTAAEWMPEEESAEAPAAGAIPEEEHKSSFRRLGETALPMAAPAGNPDDEQDDMGPEVSAEEGESVDELAVSAEEGESVDEPAAEEPKSPKYIENPLPLPKPHVKRIMDYARKPSPGEDDFDYPVNDDDDFDI